MTSIVIKRLWKMLAKQRLVLLAAFVFSAGYVPLALVGPILIGRAVDSIVGQGDVDFAGILRYLVALAITVMFGAVLQWLGLVTARRLSATLTKQIRQEAHAAVNKAPLSRIDTHPHGDIVSRIVNDAQALEEGLLQAISQLIPGAFTIVMTIVMMMILNIPIALMVVFITPLSMMFARFVAKRSAKYFKRQSQAQGQMSAKVQETVEGLELVRLFGAQQQFSEDFEKRSDAFFHANRKAIFYSSIGNPGARFINALVYAAVGVMGVLFIYSGGITVGGVSAFLSYANQYTKPFSEVSAVLTQIQAALASAERLFAVIDWTPEIPDAKDAKDIQHSDGEVVLENVQFGYDKNKPVLKNLSFKAKAGTKIALVGPTGCGKTTLVNLLMRFYDVDSGEIMLDGTPLPQIKRNSLRQRYGMVLQDTWLKQASVRDNIAYGRPNATDEDIIAAAKSVRAHGFIKRLSEGYDTVLTRGGQELSVGQRQLLCIARIMLAKPDMLILDEATSNIDTRTEMLIQRALEKLMETRTSFIVAHRLSTIENADTILVMKDGYIAEHGSHSELLAKNGFYASIYQSQFTAS